MQATLCFNFMCAWDTTSSSHQTVTALFQLNLQPDAIIQCSECSSGCINAHEIELKGNYPDMVELEEARAFRSLQVWDVGQRRVFQRLLQP